MHNIIKGKNFYYNNISSINTRGVGLLIRYYINDQTSRDDRDVDDGRDGGKKSF
jgi:hypothetical protein